MNFEQFIAGFQNPEESSLRGEILYGNPTGEVIIAATILTTTKELCCIDINGAQYEIAAGDVIDISDLVPAQSEEVAEKKGETTEAAEKAGPRLVLIKLKSNAVLERRIAVPASLVAALGTWVQVVPDAPTAP
jgi:hypothetical protein